MSSSLHPARAALTAFAALLALGPTSAGRLLTSQAGGAPRSAATETIADISIDPFTAAGDEVVSTLRDLDETVSALAADAASAAAARAAAAEALEAVEADVAAQTTEVERAAGGAPRLAGAPAEVVETPSTAAFVLWDAPPSLRPAAVGPDDAADAELDEAARHASEVARAAARREAEAEAAGAALTEATDAEVDFVASVEDRVAERLAEAETLAASDPDAAEAVREEEAAIADSVDAVVTAMEEREAAEDEPEASDADGDEPESDEPAPAPPDPAPAPSAPPAPAPPPPPPPLPDPTGSASGALAGPWCPDGRRIVVDSSIGTSVQALLNDAHSAGVDLCAKSGFRSYAEQVELRRAHCGTSDHAVYQAPPSSCSPPTARPGTSNHEGGLAIDFSCSDGQPMTHASPCFQWLAANAAAYGLHNLPSEPWHWSTTGR